MTINRLVFWGNKLSKSKLNQNETKFSLRNKSPLPPFLKSHLYLIKINEHL